VPGPFHGVVTVTDAWRAGLTARAVGEVEGAPVLLRLAAAAARPDRGSRLVVDGRLLEPRGPWHGFDESVWLAHQGIHAVLRIRGFHPVGRRGGIRGAIDRCRASALAAYAGAGEGDESAVLAGIAIGADDRLGAGARERFRRSGLAHLLAVSGGNVALLVAAVLVLVWAAGLGRRSAHVAAIVAVAGYVELVGPSPSVLRAGVAGIVASLAWLASRLADAWHAYCLGLAVILCANPYAVDDVGFQLSFAAVAAILLVAPHIRVVLDGLPFPPGLRAPAAISAACTLATAPISWLHFGRLNLIAAVPANLLALPSVPVLLWIGLAAAAVAPVAPAAAAAIAGTAWWPAAYLLGVARVGARLDAATGAYEVPVAVALVLLGVGIGFRRLPAVVSAWREREHSGGAP
jgi:competence protein ComEC